MTPSELFKPYTGMTVEGSTEKERAEIIRLLRSKTPISGSDAMYVEYGMYYSPKFSEMLPAFVVPQQSITNIPYTEFKQLIEQL